jgi:hypothetical protein
VSYESPLELIFSKIEEVEKERARALDNMVWDSVMKCGVNVDKEELIKALAYDRGQYEKGYLAGRRDRDAEIVRCQVCRNKECMGRGGQIVCGITGEQHAPDWYCGDGERAEEEDEQ